MFPLAFGSSPLLLHSIYPSIVILPLFFSYHTYLKMFSYVSFLKKTEISAVIAKWNFPGSCQVSEFLVKCFIFWWHLLYQLEQTALIRKVNIFSLRTHLALISSQSFSRAASTWFLSWKYVISGCWYLVPLNFLKYWRKIWIAVRVFLESFLIFLFVLFDWSCA